MTGGDVDGSVGGSGSTDAAQMDAPASMFATTLDEAITASGLPLARIRSLLRRQGHAVSIATLSYWRRGKVQPSRAASLAAVVELERILELPTGALTSPLEERIRPGAAAGEDVDAMAARLGLSWDDDLTRASICDMLVIDERDRIVRSFVRDAMVARKDGVERFPMGFWSEQGVPDLRIVGRRNCTVGRQIASARGLVAEVLLPRPLRAGERWVAEYEQTTENGEPSENGWGRYLLTRTGLLQYTVRFAEATVPTRAWVEITVRGETTVREVPIRGPLLSVHLRDVGPGLVDLRWSRGETPTVSA